jgi:hypothetical protein
VILIAEMFSLIAVVPLAVPHIPASTQEAPCSAMPLQTKPGGGTGAPEWIKEAANKGVMLRCLQPTAHLRCLNS